MHSFDIVVPCYRYGQFLRQCVNSVLSQEDVAVRILIIDDESPDDTEEIGTALARQDQRVSYRRHQTNRGHIATYNEGIDWARADYFLLLSADDYCIQGAFARAAAAFGAHPEVGLVFGKSLEVRSDVADPLPETRSDAPYITIPGREFINACGFRNRVPTPTAIVRTTVQRKVGAYDARLPHAGDMEMWLRIAAHADVAFVSEWQAVTRIHSSNMQRQYFDVEGGLPDLEQRRLALHSFIAKSGIGMADARSIMQRADQELARLAVAAGSSCFNSGNLTAMQSAIQFAHRIDPGVERSSAWVKLYCKSLIGNALWSVVAPFAGRLRRQRSESATEVFEKRIGLRTRRLRRPELGTGEGSEAVAAGR